MATKGLTLCGLLAAILLAVPTPARALDARIADIRTVGGSVRASLELSDMLPEKLQQVLEAGGTLHLRVQAELWEDRPLWDRLVRPALVTVYRIVRDPTTSRIAISDAVGEILSAPLVPNPLALRVEVAPLDAVGDSARYYLRFLTTIGTIAEQDVERAGKAVFGDDSSGVSLGGLGRFIFSTVVHVSDYLQSVSDETRSDTLRGRDLLLRKP